jgi:hypothetical protein
MHTQGNLLRGESLVLLVRVDIINKKGASMTPVVALSPADALQIKDRVLGQIVRHIEMRFNKRRFADEGHDLLDQRSKTSSCDEHDQGQPSLVSDGLSKLCDSAIKVETCDENEVNEIASQEHERLDDWKEYLDLKPSLLVLLCLTGQERTSDSLSSQKKTSRLEVELINSLRPKSRSCGFEFFQAALDLKRSAIYPNANPHAIHRNDNSLYHLASRVCGALTEYVAFYDSREVPVQDRKRVDSLLGSGCWQMCAGRSPFIQARIIDSDWREENEAVVRPKILDIRDAVSLLCEGLDGTEQFFPPVPRGLQSIFAGLENDTKQVASRYKFPFGVWFRGQSRVSFNNVPSLFHENAWGAVHPGCQKINSDKAMYDETTMVHHFMSHKPLLRRDYLDKFEWLCLMQHHGAPTRMLDWTENVLIALYFAVRDPQADCDGVVWALNAGRLNEITRVSTSRRYVCIANSADVVLRSAMAVSRTGAELRRTLLKEGRLEEVMDGVPDAAFWKWVQGKGPREASVTWHKLAAPVAVFPTRVNSREENQLATFAICGGKQYDARVTSIPERERFPRPLGLVDLSRKMTHTSVGKSQSDWCRKTSFWTPTGKPFLDAFIVPSCAKRKLREQLKRVGVHIGALFPELEHQAQFIRHQWRFEHEE